MKIEVDGGIAKSFLELMEHYMTKKNREMISYSLGSSCNFDSPLLFDAKLYRANTEVSDL